MFNNYSKKVICITLLLILSFTVASKADGYKMLKEKPCHRSDLEKAPDHITGKNSFPDLKLIFLF